MRSLTSRQALERQIKKTVLYGMKVRSMRTVFKRCCQHETPAEQSSVLSWAVDNRIAAWDAAYRTKLDIAERKLAAMIAALPKEFQNDVREGCESSGLLNHTCLACLSGFGLVGYRQKGAE